MISKPKDEMSLRHLFSTNYASNILSIDYWGPVMNDLGQIEPSPDCIVLDKRQGLYTLKRCEFKYIPRSKAEYKHNGSFDMTIVWSLPVGLDVKSLCNELKEQNGCLEVIVLSNMKAFSRLPEYSIPEQVNFALIHRLKDFLLVREPDVIVSAYLIAKAYPSFIDINKLKEILIQNFRRVRHMLPQGQGNVIARFIQMKPPLIEHQYGNYYCWNNLFELNASIAEMERLMNENFRLSLPADDLIDRVKV